MSVDIDVSDHERECIDNCLEAAQVCEWCADACADENGMARCVRLCRDAADFATLHARLMARRSGYSDDLAAVCVDVFEECAEECSQHEHDHCRACADVLPEAAETCREMASR